MKMKRAGKYLGLTLALTVICTGVLFALNNRNVFAEKFKSSAPYIVGDNSTRESCSAIVTDEGSLYMGEEGSGAEPCDEEVPTASGKKGTVTNPFVVLEIVPDKGMTEMTYLAGDHNSGFPKGFDMIKVGIEATQRANRCFVPYDKTSAGGNNVTKDQDLTHYSFIQSFGSWFYSYQYTINKFGTDPKNPEQERACIAQIDELFSIDFSSEAVAAMSAEEQAAYSAAQKTPVGLAQALPDKFTYETEDSKGNKVTKAIPEYVIEDTNNWAVNMTTKTITSGYMIVTEDGKGDFAFNGGDTDLTPSEKKRLRWRYSETKPTTGTEITDSNWIQNNLYNGNANDGGAYVGYYYHWEKPSWYWKEGMDVPTGYKYSYYGLKANDVLKRSLFIFQDQAECDKFHIKVICKTPAEINAISEKDTGEKLDLIERADMFTITTYEKTSQNQAMNTSVYERYYRYVAESKNESYTYQDGDMTSFYENDLEWDLCMKLIKRMSEHQNMPVAFNQVVGTMAEEGVDQNGSSMETSMYVSNVSSARATNGTLNNITKLYLIAVQFDLLARKSSGSSGVSLDRTFMEDLYKEIDKIKLEDTARYNNKSKDDFIKEHTAKYTGYYYRPLVSESDKTTRYCDYLWNQFTFWPSSTEKFSSADVTKDYPGFDAGLTQTDYIAQGYLKTYANTNAQPFRDAGSIASHFLGSDGRQYDDSDDSKIQNVTILNNGGQVANVNQSHLLTPTGGEDTGNTMTQIYFRIINNKPSKVNDLTVQVLKAKKYYERVDDTLVWLDYTQNSKTKYSTETLKKPRFLYVQINNGVDNNEDGIVKSIKLCKGSTKKEVVPLNAPNCSSISDASTTTITPLATSDGTSIDSVKLSKEIIKDRDDKNPVEGYRVPVSVAAGSDTAESTGTTANTIKIYIPFTLEMWRDGFDTVEIVTAGRHYTTALNSSKLGSDKTDSIEISERTLFDLK